MTKKELSEAKPRKIRKSNELIQKARYKLSVPGQKILLYLISQIPYDAEEFQPMVFDIPEFCAVCGIPAEGGNYRMLEDALTDLLTDSARVWITLENGVRTPIMWIERPEIDPATGKVTVKLDKAMKPYLLQLKSHYTSYELIYTLHFRSKYSIRLYEIVRPWQYSETKPFTKYYPVDELRELLDAENYVSYRDFKRRVLLPAVKEINEYSDKNVNLREYKVGQAGKVQTVELVITAKTGAELDAVRELIGAPKRKRSVNPSAADASEKPSNRP